MSHTPRQARYYATKTLGRVFDGGYLKRLPVIAPAASTDQLSNQIVHALTATGARAIGLDPILTARRAPKRRSVLLHDFRLANLGVLAFEGCPEGLSITHCWNDRVLSARKRKGRLSLPTIPDALLVMHNQTSSKDFPCLVKLDLGTESITFPSRMRQDFSRKIEGYLDYLRASFQAEFGIVAPAIVLIVTDFERRLASLRFTTTRLSGAGRFWFSTLPCLGGEGDSNDSSNVSSAALYVPFWELSWQTAANDQPRSLATRCGL